MRCVPPLREKNQPDSEVMVKNGCVRGISGGVSEEVGELSECVVFSFEVEAYPEPKILNQNELKELCELHGSQGKVAKAVSCSRSFVTRSVNRTKSKDGY